MACLYDAHLPVPMTTIAIWPPFLLPARISWIPDDLGKENIDTIHAKYQTATMVKAFSRLRFGEELEWSISSSSSPDTLMITTSVAFKIL